MAVPIAAIVGAAGLAASLSKKNKVSPINDSGMREAVNAGADTQIRTAQGLTSAMQPLSATYKADSNANSAALKNDTAGLGKAYIESMKTLGDEAGTNASNTLKQNVLAAQPDIQRSLRESLAASGGLDRGAAPVAAARAGQEAAAQIGQGESAIAQRKIANLEAATTKVFGANTAAVTQATGMDQGTINTLLASGRQDLISEAQSIMEAERNRTTNLLGIQQNTNTLKLASESAKAGGNNALMSSLLGSAGQAVGSYYGSKGS